MSVPILREKVSLRSMSQTRTIPVADTTRPIAASTTMPVEISPSAAAISTAKIGITRTVRLVSELVNSQLRAKSSV